MTLMLAAACLTVFTFWAKADTITNNIAALNVAPEQQASEALSAATVLHLKTPEFVKGIYMSAAVAGHTTLRRDLIDLVARTELNTMVIDVKDDAGYVAYRVTDPALVAHSASKLYIKDLPELIRELHEKNIYLVARLVVFQDPAYVGLMPIEAVQNVNGGLWRDYRGKTWIDPADEVAWRYNVALARDAYAQGFDEIQFDYIRFPSDGDMKTVKYPFFNPDTDQRAEVIKKFFAYLDQELRQHGIPISADLFGFSYWWRDDDLTIGQRIRDAAPYFTALSPMVYPSHYPRGTLNFVSPANHPYEIIDETLKRGNDIMKEWPEVKFATRPWIQDFKVGAVYTPAMIKKEMRAVRDNGGSGWLLWNARNVYTEAALAGK